MKYSLGVGYMGKEERTHKEDPDFQGKMLAAFVEHLPSVAVIKDLKGHLLFVNPAWEKTFQKRWLRKTSRELWPPKVAAMFDEHDQIVCRTREPLVTVGTLEHADGMHHWISYRFPIFDAEGKMVMIGVNAMDITEHIQTKAWLEHWLESGPMAIFTREPRGDFAFTYLSKNIQALMGWEPQRFLTDPRFWFNQIHPEDQSRIQEQLALPWREDHQSLEYRIQAQDGSYRWIHDTVRMVRDKIGNPLGIAGAWLDITERKNLEAQLIQAQKMEAVGRLAGGVAHDFNNLLMAIMGYGELLRTSFYQDDPMFHYIEDILKATDRAASLTQQLLAFSRRQIRQPRVLNLNRVVADLEKMLRRLIGEHIELEIIAESDLWMVQADSGQLGQVIINLALNARDAMPTGGRLTLATANTDFAASQQTRIDLIPPGKYVQLTITDSGAGMDVDTLSHIFEPFFTTKEAGRGSGLGVPVVYGIVRQNDGYIDVESQPGQGTVFMVYLPRSENAAEPALDPRLPRAQLEGSETILIVEDEMALRALLSRFFRLYGYDVLEARDGDEALFVGGRHQGPIHIMLTDVVMPRMSGRELADRLMHLHPEMQVFYMSGYSDRELAPFGIREPSKTIIPKPFRPLDLVRRVREFLDTPQEKPNNTQPS
jgi:two-component system cell cycle sensor histidine kinase/response regulator CckA